MIGHSDFLNTGQNSSSLLFGGSKLFKQVTEARVFQHYHVQTTKAAA